jgi:hypothetical protein
VRDVVPPVIGAGENSAVIHNPHPDTVVPQLRYWCLTPIPRTSERLPG